MSETPLKEATTVRVRAHKVKCPHCNADADGWYGDPRGKETTCDECDKEFKVAADAELQLE